MPIIVRVKGSHKITPFNPRPCATHRRRNLFWLLFGWAKEENTPELQKMILREVERNDRIDALLHKEKTNANS